MEKAPSCPSAAFLQDQLWGITIDGIDIKRCNISWLWAQIGVVFQEPVLFDRSIAANIRYGASFREVGDEEVVEAARSANINDFITSLPEVVWGVCVCVGGVEGLLCKGHVLSFCGFSYAFALLFSCIQLLVAML